MDISELILIGAAGPMPGTALGPAPIAEWRGAVLLNAGWRPSALWFRMDAVLRDCDVIIDVPATKPHRNNSHIIGRRRYRFTDCNYDARQQAGNPSGYVWGAFS